MLPSPKSSAKGTPLLSSAMLIGLFIIVPVGFYILFTKWAGSPDRQIAGCCGLLALMLLAFQRNKYETLLASLIFFSQFNISLISFPLNEPAVFQITFSDVVLALFLLAAVERRERLRPDLLGKIFLLLIGWQCLSVFHSAHLHRSLLFIYVQLKYLLVYLLVLNLEPTDRFAQQICKTVLLVIAIQGCLGIAEFVHEGPFGLSIIGEPIKSHIFFGGFRVSGTLGAVNAFAGFLAGLLIFLTPFLVASAANRFLVWSGFAVGFTSLILTLSRAGWFSFLAGFFAGFFILTRTKLIKPSRILLLGMAGLLTGITIIAGVLLYRERIEQRFTEKSARSSAMYRYEQFSQAWPLIKKHSFWGIGPGVTEYFGAWNDYRTYLSGKLSGMSLGNQPHNSILQFWVEGGYPAGILWSVITLLVIVTAATQSKRGAHENPGAFILRQAASLGALALALSNQFGTEVNNSQLQMVFWIFLAFARNRTLQKWAAAGSPNQKPIS